MKTSDHSLFSEKFHGKLGLSNSAILRRKVPAPISVFVCVRVEAIGKDNFYFITSDTFLKNPDNFKT